MEIKVLDPACGSGAFLNQAFNFLYTEGQRVNDKITELSGGQTELFGLDKHILSNNLFGVDLNEESVEITKLSLWIKTANKLSELTALDNNIKCGNSLIDDPVVAGDKAFNWEIEFAEIIQNGGFDVVIGNPPYGIVQDKPQEEYFKVNYPLTNYKTNLYLLFIERMINLFKASKVQFIIPKSLLFNVFYSKIREYLLKNCSIEEIFTLEEKVFADAEVGDSLMIKISVNRRAQKNLIRIISIDKFTNFVAEPEMFTSIIDQDYFLCQPNFEITALKNRTATILKKILSNPQVKNSYVLKNGLNPGNIKNILISHHKLNETYKPIIWGRDITRYSISWSGDYIIYDSTIADNITIENTISKSGMRKQERIDFALRDKSIFETKKLVIRKTGDSLIAAFDNDNYYFDTLVHGIYSNNLTDLKFLLGILNSKPATIFYRLLHDIKGKVFAKISLEQLAQFPVPDTSDENKSKFVAYVDNILNNTKEFTNINSEFVKFFQGKFSIGKLTTKLQNWYELEYNEFLSELTKAKVNISLEEQLAWQPLFAKQKAQAQELKRIIDETDRQIDRMVFELYGLTEEEIRIVEGKG